MSVARNRRAKERKSARPAEHKAIKNKIRNGSLPRYYFVKDLENDSKLERSKDGLTWARKSTYLTLTK